jgi:hypothetical protein
MSLHPICFFAAQQMELGATQKGPYTSRDKGTVAVIALCVADDTSDQDLWLAEVPS